MINNKRIVIVCLTLLSFLLISCKSNKVDIDNSERHLKYKIIKIVSKNDVYIIYAKNHDSFYKILTLRNNSENPSCKKIKIGKEYELNLVSLDVPIYADGLDFHGEPILLERDSINELHTAKNLAGLCLVKQKSFE
jgi:hypothetical protein